MHLQKDYLFTTTIHDLPVAIKLHIVDGEHTFFAMFGPNKATVATLPELLELLERMVDIWLGSLPATCPVPPHKGPDK